MILSKFIHFLKKIKNSSGFSLAEVMVAAGMLGVVSLGVMQLSKMQTSTSKRANMDLDLNQIVFDMENTMRDPENCLAALSGNTGANVSGFSAFVDYPANNWKAFNNIWRFDANGNYSGLAYTASTTYLYGVNKNIRIDTMRAKPAGAVTPGVLATYDIEVKFGVKNSGDLAFGKTATNTVAGVGQRELLIVKRFTISAMADAANKITACVRDLADQAQAYCDYFNGTIESDASGKPKCRSVVIATKTGSSTSIRAEGDLLTMTKLQANSISATTTLSTGNEATIGGFLTTQGYATVGGNLTVNGGTISAPVASSIGLGNGGTTIPTVNIGTGSGAPLVNIGAANNGRLNVRSLIDDTTNFGSGTGATVRTYFNSSNLGGNNPNISATGGSMLLYSATGPIDTINNSTINISSLSGATLQTRGAGTTSVLASSGSVVIDGSSSTTVEGGSNNLIIDGTDARFSGKLKAGVYPNLTYGVDDTYVVSKGWVLSALTDATSNLFSSGRAEQVIAAILNKAVDAGGSAGASYGVFRNAILNYFVDQNESSCTGQTAIRSFNNGSFTANCVAIPVAPVNPNKTCPANQYVSAISYDASTGNFSITCSGLPTYPPDCTTTADARCTQLCIDGECLTSWGFSKTCAAGQYVKGFSEGGVVCGNVRAEVKTWFFPGGSNSYGLPTELQNGL